MTTRREAISLLGSISLGSMLAPSRASIAALSSHQRREILLRKMIRQLLAPGTPTSPERMALIEAFNKKSDGVEANFEPRSYKSDFDMPYRLFKPDATGKLKPLVRSFCMVAAGWATTIRNRWVWGMCLVRVSSLFRRTKNAFPASCSRLRPTAAGFATETRLRANLYRNQSPAWETEREWRWILWIRYVESSPLMSAAFM